MKGCIAIVVATILVGCVLNVASQSVKYQPKPAWVPKKCRFPEKSSMTLIDLHTVNKEKLTLLDTQIDAVTQRQVMVNYSFDPTTYNNTERNRVIIDYMNSMLYSVVDAYPDYCFKMPFNETLITQIPDDAVYVGSSYLGPAFDNHTLYDGWRFSSPSGNLKFTIAVTRLTCAPLMESVDVLNLPNYSMSVVFDNFLPKLTNPKAFVIPKACFK